MAKKNKKPIIFVSHTALDKEISIALKNLLLSSFRNEIDVFVSSDENSIKLGDSWYNTIIESLKNCELGIIICSPVSINKQWINFEAGFIVARDKPVIPVCHSGLDIGQLVSPLNNFQGCNLGSEEHQKKLINIIKDRLGLESFVIAEKEFNIKVAEFESKVKNSLLFNDISFVKNLLHRNTELLKIGIYYSAYNSDTNPTSIELNENNFTFNDIYHLLEHSCLIMDFSSNKKNYNVFYENIIGITESIKFLLTYNKITITPKLNALFHNLLCNSTFVENWYHSITNLSNKWDINDQISLIKSSELPATRKFSNAVNVYIDYYDSLIFYKTWIIEYEKEINSILSFSN